MLLATGSISSSERDTMGLIDYVWYMAEFYILGSEARLETYSKDSK